MVKIGNFLFHYRNGLLPLLFFGIFIPSPKVFENPVWALIAGLSISVIGQVIRGATIGLVYIIRGGRARKIYAQDLVTTGIFAHSRNPLYLGNVMVGIGMGLASNNLIFFALITVVITFIYQAIILAEENFLEATFGKAFVEYKSRVNRWFPSLSGLGKTLNDYTFAWRRLIVKEYNSTFTGSTLALLLIAKAVYENPTYFQDQGQTYVILGVIWLVIAVIYLTIKILKKQNLLLAESQTAK